MTGSPSRLLSPCPTSPNCVSSEAEDDKHRVDPIAIRGDAAAAMKRLAEVIAALPRARVIRASPDAVDAEFTSRVFRFVDDVECRLNPAKGVIEIRSASRVGYSDFGVNRERVEEIRVAMVRR